MKKTKEPTVQAKPDPRKAILDQMEALKARLAAIESTPKIIPPKPVKKLDPTDRETILKAVAASLDQYGTVVPPREVTYMLSEAECPRCGHQGPIPTDFGFTKSRTGETRPQSWCKKCRSSPASHPSRSVQGRKKY